jgi:hypothetical protein
VVHSLHERDGGAEATHRLCHLGADRSGAEDEQPPRGGFQAGDLTVGPDAVELAQAGDGWDDRFGAGGEDDVRGRQPLVADGDGARPGDTAAAPVEVDPVVGEPLRLGRVVVVGDDEVAPRERLVDVDRPGDGLARARRVASAPERLAGPQQGL